MINWLKTYLMHISVMAGVEIEIGLDGTLSIHVALVEQKRRTLRMIRGEYELTSIAALRTFLPDNVPVAVCLTGKAIFHKVSFGDVSERAAPASPAVPSQHPPDLIHQVIDVEKTHIVSRTRSNIFDSIILALQAERIALLAVSLGPFSLLPFLNQLEKDTQSVRFGKHELQLNTSSELIGYRWVEEQSFSSLSTVKFGGTAMNHRAFPAFIIAFAVMVNAKVPAPEQLENQEAVIEYNYRSCFQRSTRGILAIVLLLLLINTAVYLAYSPHRGDDTTILIPVRQHELDSLRRLLSSRDTLISGLGIQQGSVSPAKAYIADQLAVSLPQSVVLTTLAFNRTDEARSRRLRKPVVIPRSVCITGSCDELPQVMHWIDYLRSLDFCQDVQLVHYLFDARRATGNFEITLTLNK